MRFDKGKPASAELRRGHFLAAMLAAFFTLSVGAQDSGWKYRWPVLFPAVTEHTFEAGTCVVLDDRLVVKVSCADGTDNLAWTAGKFKSWFGNRPKTVAVTGGFDGLPSGVEAYGIDARPGEVKIAARTAVGVKWAMMTLRQLAQATRGTLTVKTYEIPALHLVDAPETAFRALHLCAFPEVSLSRIEHGIRMAAYYKFNHVILEMWGSYRSEALPWYGWKDGYLTVSECRRLAAVAKDLGVEIIPLLNIFGHAPAARTKAGKHAALDASPKYQTMFEPVYGYNWCLSNPHVLTAQKALVRELYEVFGRPAHFHLGGDEADPPTCAACCSVDYGQLLARHMKQLTAYVKNIGARPMIWHDMLLKNKDPRWKGFCANGTDETVKLVDELPKDVIVCDWYYGSPPKDGHYPTLDYFREKGFDVMTCPFENTGGIRSQCTYARKNGAGVIVTTWHHYITKSVWDIYTVGGSCAWSSAAANALMHANDLIYSMQRFTFATHWRETGWDTPSANTYGEWGFFPEQINKTISE